MILDRKSCSDYLARQTKPRVNVGAWLWAIVLIGWGAFLIWSWLT